MSADGRKITRAEWLRDLVSAAPVRECIEWPFATGKGGYGNVFHEGRFTNAHRVICAMKHGLPPSETHQAAHNCGNRCCVNPAHIRWKTPAENNKDKEVHGTTRRGGKSNFAALSISDVRRVRRTFAENPDYTIDQLAKACGVGRSNAWLIVTGKTWVGVA